MTPKGIGIMISILVLMVVLSVSFWWYSLDLQWIPSCTGSGGHWGQRQYYDGYGVPDGWYRVWTYEGSVNGTVVFPLCPNSGSRLHGTWETWVYIPSDFGGEVRVRNNIIVGAKP